MKNMLGRTWQGSVNTGTKILECERDVDSMSHGSQAPAQISD